MTNNQSHHHCHCYCRHHYCYHCHCYCSCCYHCCLIVIVVIVVIFIYSAADPLYATRGFMPCRQKRCTRRDDTVGASHVSTPPRNRRHRRNELHPCQARALPSLVQILSVRSVARVQVKSKQQESPKQFVSPGLLADLHVAPEIQLLGRRSPSSRLSWTCDGEGDAVEQQCQSASKSFRVPWSRLGSTFMQTATTCETRRYQFCQTCAHRRLSVRCSVPFCRIETDASAGSMMLTAFQFQS